MNEQEFLDWGAELKRVVIAEIILEEKLRNKEISISRYKEIKNKIKKISYKNFLNSPHLEGKEELRKNAFKLCLNDYFSSVV